MNEAQENVCNLMLAHWPHTWQHPDPVAYFKACAEHMTAHAEACGVALRVDRQSREPLAMGNHIPVVEAWGHKP